MDVDITTGGWHTGRTAHKTGKQRMIIILSCLRCLEEKGTSRVKFW